MMNCEYVGEILLPNILELLKQSQSEIYSKSLSLTQNHVFWGGAVPLVSA